MTDFRNWEELNKRRISSISTRVMESSINKRRRRARERAGEDSSTVTAAKSTVVTISPSSLPRSCFSFFCNNDNSGSGDEVLHDCKCSGYRRLQYSACYCVVPWILRLMIRMILLRKIRILGVLAAVVYTGTNNNHHPFSSSLGVITTVNAFSFPLSSSTTPRCCFRRIKGTRIRNPSNNPCCYNQYYHHSHASPRSRSSSALFYGDDGGDNNISIKTGGDNETEAPLTAAATTTKSSSSSGTPRVPFFQRFWKHQKQGKQQTHNEQQQQQHSKQGSQEEDVATMAAEEDKGAEIETEQPRTNPQPVVIPTVMPLPPPEDNGETTESSSSESPLSSNSDNTKTTDTNSEANDENKKKAKPTTAMDAFKSSILRNTKVNSGSSGNSDDDNSSDGVNAALILTSDEDDSSSNSNNKEKRKATDPLTAEDLVDILNAQGFVRKADLLAEQQQAPLPSSPSVSSFRQQQQYQSLPRSSNNKNRENGLASAIGQPVSGGIRHRFIKRQQQQQEQEQPESSASSDKPSKGAAAATTTTTGMVAWPQPSVFSYEALTWGTTASAAVMGLFLGLSITPSLWLAGAALGSLYGYETGKGIQRQGVAAINSSKNGKNEAVPPPKLPTSVVPLLLVSAGRKLATFYLKLYDRCTVLWFMFKTGELSYEYYQRYATMDQRFGIQRKLDAWNARFQDGKIAFDKWEKENEVGRKVLASLRTLWLVEQETKNIMAGGSAGSGTSRLRTRYRVLQIFYDAAFWTRRALASVWNAVVSAVVGRGDSEILDFCRGVRRRFWYDDDGFGEEGGDDGGPWMMVTAGKLTSRAGGAFGALLAVYLAGALFSVWPKFLALLAVTGGLLRPTWFAELWDRMGRFADDMCARGRNGDDYDGASGLRQEQQQQRRATRRPARGMDNFANIFGSSFSNRGRTRNGKVDKRRYHYYTGMDGKKRYYRKGTPWLPFGGAKPKQETSQWSWPWQQQTKERKWWEF